MEKQPTYKKDFSQGGKCVEKMREISDKRSGSLFVVASDKKQNYNICEKQCENTDTLKADPNCTYIFLCNREKT